MKIGGKDTSESTFIIAEIGNNHEGDFDLAQEMVWSAAEAGADRGEDGEAGLACGDVALLDIKIFTELAGELCSLQGGGAVPGDVEVAVNFHIGDVIGHGLGGRGQLKPQGLETFFCRHLWFSVGFQLVNPAESRGVMVRNFQAGVNGTLPGPAGNLPGGCWFLEFY